MINDNIEIKIISLRSDQVKIGIIAPKNVKVYRQEIFEEIQKANVTATTTNLDALKDVLKKNEE